MNNWFDFNDARAAYPELGSLSQDVELALSERKGSRESVVAALAVSRELVRVPPEAPLSAKTKAALAEVSAVVAEVEYSIRAMDDGVAPPKWMQQRKRGRPRDDGAKLNFQASAVIAFELLQRLSVDPYSEEKALKEVAAVIPSKLCGEYTRGEKRRTKKAPRDALRYWRGEFSKQAGLRFGIIRDLWRNLVSVSDNENDIYDAPPSAILSWVKTSIPKQSRSNKI